MTTTHQWKTRTIVSCIHPKPFILVWRKNHCHLVWKEGLLIGATKVLGYLNLSVMNPSVRCLRTSRRITHWMTLLNLGVQSPVNFLLIWTNRNPMDSFLILVHLMNRSTWKIKLNSPLYRYRPDQDQKRKTKIKTWQILFAMYQRLVHLLDLFWTLHTISKTKVINLVSMISRIRRVKLMIRHKNQSSLQTVIWIMSTWNLRMKTQPSLIHKVNLT